MSTRARLLVLILPLVSLTVVPSAASEDAATTRWTYRVRFARDLSSASVRVDFHGFTPRRLVLYRSDALRAVRLASPYRANPSRDGIVPRGQTVSYTVDFRRLAQIVGAQTRPVGRDLVTRAGLFLLHPPNWPPQARAEVVFGLPPGVHAAVPWLRDIAASNRRSETVYLVPSHAMADHARIAFGHAAPRRVVTQGCDVRYHVLDGPRRATDTGIQQWLSTAMGAAVQLYGRAPVSQLHVILQPLVPGRGRPIVFGRASLSGGPLVHAMLSGTTTDERMPGEWITIHELLHLGMPVTRLADRWFQEGWVSYYQEVVRARAGIITPQVAWQNLHRWMQRGRASGGKRPLADESRTMTNSYAYHRVYWGGAALALKMDARIRIVTNGAKSLDDVVRHFHANHVTPGVPIDALALMKIADAVVGHSICEPIARAALSSRTFPELGPTFASMGLRVADDRVLLAPNAPHARHRDAIMRPAGR